MKKIILLLFLINCNLLTAQNSLAKIEYSYAEEAFNKKEYTKTLKHLEEVKSLLGSTNARILFLEILSRSNSLPSYQTFNTVSLANEIIGVAANESDSNNTNYIIKNWNTPFQINNMNKSKSSSVKTIPLLIESFNFDKENNRSTINLLTHLKNKLEKGLDVSSSDFSPSVFNKLSLNKENISSEIKNWLQGLELINSLSDTYLANFENDVPIEKLKKIYEIKKQNKIYISNRELIESSWKVFINKEYKIALGRFNALDNAGVDNKNIIKQIKKYHVATAVISTIENNMVFVEGNQKIEGKIPNLYVSKYEITSNEFFTIRNFAFEIYDRSFYDPRKCYKCPLKSRRTSVEKFINELNNLSEKKYRLPTKEEWYWLATGGLKTTDEERGKNKEKSKNINDYAWFFENNKDSKAATQPVGLKLPNELGLYDVWGNLAEYTTTNAVGGSVVTKKKKLIKGNSYSYSYEWDNEAVIYKGFGTNFNGIRLVLTADKTKE